MPEQPEELPAPSGLRARRDRFRQQRAAPPPQHPRQAGAPALIQPITRPETESADADAPAVAESGSTGPPRQRHDETQVGSFDAPLRDVAANPWNTRDVNARPAKVQSLAESIRRLGRQLQTCPAVTREAFLRCFPPKKYPEQAKAIGDAPYVQVPGARRRAALFLIGSPTIRIEIDDSLADSPEKFLDATLSENDDREPLDPIEEARALKLEVDFAPSVASVARKRNCSDATIFYALHLLELDPEVQAALRADEPTPRLPTREVRGWHKKSRDEQLELLLRWRRRNDPAYTAEEPDGADAGESRPPKLSPTRKLLLRLGETPEAMAQTAWEELTEPEREAYVAKLLTLREQAVQS